MESAVGMGAARVGVTVDRDKDAAAVFPFGAVLDGVGFILILL